MKEKLESIRQEALAQVENAPDLDTLNQLRVQYLGKKGAITAVLKDMGKLPAEERPVVGKIANEVKDEIGTFIAKRVALLEEVAKLKQLETEKIDLTLPGQPVQFGQAHPMTQVYNELKRIFVGMGFDIAEGPEVETEYFNFEALNIPRWHPARDMQDTFFFGKDVVLRTHTSPVQVRTMQKGELPIRIVAPGRVYRMDELDASHSPNFQQLEGLVIDKGINFGHLKETLAVLARSIFGADRKTRFRPSYFPFTEPSAEIDLSCSCGGAGCKVCKGTGWLEIGGSGMVHPRVLEMSGIDPEEYSGFAFGMGIERIVMLKYGITDIRLLYENDLRFLEQF